MLTNGTLLRIDTPSSPDVAGRVAFVTGTAVAVRGFFGPASKGVRISEAGRQADASDVAYLPLTLAEPSGGFTGKRLVYRLDTDAAGSGPRVLEAVAAQRMDKGASPVSHWRVELREVRP